MLIIATGLSGVDIDYQVIGDKGSMLMVVRAVIVSVLLVVKVVKGWGLAKQGITK